MDKENIKEKLYSIQNLIGKGKIDYALNELLSLCRKVTHLNEITNSIILFQSTNSYLFNDEIIIGSYKQEEKARLINGVLQIINKAFEIIETSSTPSNEGQINKYLKSVIYDFQKWQNRFVHLNSEEIVTAIPIYAQEVSSQTEEESELKREGIISELRFEIEEKQIILLGQAGMGKSTTLQYIAYYDSMKLLEMAELKLSSRYPLPVYIELKLFTDQDSIIEKIRNKIGIDINSIYLLLDEGKMSLLLDGLNEVEKNLKQKIFNQIMNFILSYPKTKIIITSRSNHYQREFDNNSTGSIIPVFQLKKMSDSQISEFLAKNGSRVKTIIINEIKKNDNLRRIVENPLLLFMLIMVVTKEGNIPSNKSKIIKIFMRNILLRERQEKDILFDFDSVHFLLCFLAFETRKFAGSNVGIDRNKQLIPLLEKKKEKLGVNINIFYFLDKIVELQIMVKDENMYSFTHEVYQEYFAAEYMKKSSDLL